MRLCPLCFGSAFHFLGVLPLALAPAHVHLLYSCAGSECCLISCLDDTLEADEAARTVVTYSTGGQMER